MTKISIPEKRCNKCGIKKGASEFYKERDKVCRSCTQARRSERRRADKTASEKRCCDCGRVKPRTEFTAPSRPNALQARCHECADRRRAGLLPLHRPDNKRCNKCGEVKPLSEFYQRTGRRSGVNSQCKQCRDADNKRRYQTSPHHRARVAVSSKKFRENNSEKIKKQKKRYSESEGYKAKLPEFKAKARNNMLVRKYGIDQEQYENMLAEQGGVCAICRQYRTDKTKRLHIDHSHADNTVRGLLCGACNGILGRWKDSPEIAQRAVDYLLKHRQLKLVV